MVSAHECSDCVQGRATHKLCIVPLSLTNCSSSSDSSLSSSLSVTSLPLMSIFERRLDGKGRDAEATGCTEPVRKRRRKSRISLATDR